MIVPQAHRAVAGFAAAGGLSGVRVVDVRACVSEAVTNAVLHAFRDGRTAGRIMVSAHFTGEALIVTVGDDGIGFLPRSDSPGLGLGLTIIRRLSDSMTVADRALGGTEVSMAFNLVDPHVSEV
jgi:serine/threonine-protein kinase RsbW/stage II sporulation protein AB (anti-sigma F factor)